MSLNRNKLLIDGWYNDVQSSIELLHIYLDDIEKQVQKDIKDFEDKTEKIALRNQNPKSKPKEYFKSISIYKDLDSEAWHLPTIFKDYFPQLKRRSALITIYSFFEFELEKICYHCQDVRGIRITPKDLRGDGVFGNIKYLTHVVGMQIDKNHDPLINKLKIIQKVRNSITHRNGVLSGANNNEELKIIKDNNLLESINNEIILKEGYLKSILNIFQSYFRYIHQSLEEKIDGYGPSYFDGDIPF